MTTLMHDCLREFSAFCVWPLLKYLVLNGGITAAKSIYLSLVVIGGDSNSEGLEFESQHCKLDGIIHIDLS